MRLTDLRLCFYAAIVNHDTKSEGNMMSSESGMSHNCGSFGRKKLWVDKEKEGHEKAKQKQEVVQMQKMNLKNEERELMWL